MQYSKRDTYYFPAARMLLPFENGLMKFIVNLVVVLHAHTSSLIPSQINDMALLRASFFHGDGDFWVRQSP